MKKAVLLAAAATVALTGTAQAQICAGYPSSDRGFYFGARADFPENADSYGVEANYNFSGPLGVYGGLNVLSAEGSPDGDEGLNEYFAGVALEAPSLGLMIGPRVSACAVGEVRTLSDDGNTYTQIPLGLGLGASLGVPGVPVSAYVQPQLVISRNDIEGIDSETETDFAIKAGAFVGFGLITVGGEVRHSFQDQPVGFVGSQTTFGIRAGIRI